MPERAFLVHGRVQGVGFRWWTRSQAQRLRLTGTVRNRADGAVEVRVRGTEEALAALRGLLQSGPPAAAVERVEEQAATGTPEEGFEIVH